MPSRTRPRQRGPPRRARAGRTTHPPVSHRRETATRSGAVTANTTRRSPPVHRKRSQSRNGGLAIRSCRSWLLLLQTVALPPNASDQLPGRLQTLQTSESKKAGLVKCIRSLGDDCFPDLNYIGSCSIHGDLWQGKRVLTRRTLAPIFVTDCRARTATEQTETKAPQLRDRFIVLSCNRSKALPLTVAGSQPVSPVPRKSKKPA
jgi:hypothetical protein